jgi:hypothetical protein
MGQLKNATEKTAFAIFECQMIKLLILVRFKSLPGTFVKIGYKKYSE